MQWQSAESSKFFRMITINYYFPIHFSVKKSCVVLICDLLKLKSITLHKNVQGKFYREHVFNTIYEQ
jgi:hypothetical protein